MSGSSTNPVFTTVTAGNLPVAATSQLANTWITGIPTAAPTLNGVSFFPGLINAANDAAAASAGIGVGGLYRNGSVTMVRVS